MRTRFVGSLVLAGVAAFAFATSAFSDPLRPRKLAGVINDFSPASTNPAGPYLVNGVWSLQIHPTGKAVFSASLTMVHSDLWFVDNMGDPESQADRNHHTHHVVMTNGRASTEDGTLVVEGTALVTGNGNAAFPASPVRIELTGGSAVSPSNIRLIFDAPASNHFTNVPYEGVVVTQ